MASVSCIIPAVDRNDAMLSHEIITMDVSGITVSVIVFMRFPNLTFIHPHAGLKVWMSHIHALIKDSDND